MKVDVKIPDVGESVQEALLVEWYCSDGDRVRKDQILFLIETDKVTLEVVAEAEGILHILVPEGETVSVGAVVATIEGVEAQEKASKGEEEAQESQEEERPKDVPAAGVEAAGVEAKGAEDGKAAERPEEEVREEKPETDPHREEAAPTAREEKDEPLVAPSARKLMDAKGIDPSAVKGTGPGGRVTQGDVMLHLEERGEAAGDLSAETSEEKVRARPEQKRTTAPESRDEKASARPKPSEEKEGPSPSKTPPVPSRESRPASEASEAAEKITRKPMSPIRRRIAEHLLHARQSTAMLTTFNEVDMSRVQTIRRNLRDAFREKYGVSLGIMSFFIKASVMALKEIPEVNAFIDGNDIVYHDYHHIGVAIGGDRGLVVPVIRHADRLNFAEIEGTIGDFVKKIREKKLEISHMEGGTFTISNGGVYGSLLSTPILNTPQSGILGLHKIEDRPVVVNGEIVVRPMMYVALSYDHRIIDGREAVTFLKRIKECIENPERIMVEV